MRRRSERKRSTDVSSPAPASRRTSRRSRKTSETASEKGAQLEMFPQGGEAEKEACDANCADEVSNEDQMPELGRKNRARNRTPVKDRSSPAKRKNQNSAIELKIDAIPEENNSIQEQSQNTEEKDNESNMGKEELAKSTTEVRATLCSLSPKTNVEDNMKPLDVLEIQAEDHDEEKLQSQEALCNNENVVTKEEVVCDRELENTETQNTNSTVVNKLNIEVENTESTDTLEKEKCAVQSPKPEGNDNENKTEVRVRKRKWITKRMVENRSPLLIITTETLKCVIPEVVHPVPLSELNLDSSPEVQEVNSEREEGEKTPSPEREIHRTITNYSGKAKRSNQSEAAAPPITGSKVNVKVEHRSLSPPNNKTSNVLFITNLVRPFTVLQLKGLLARTGKIVEDGFWIDRIKSKCYVQYETEDEAIETRHALHGVRWPVSNPKCLIVDFGKKSDMDRAFQTTKDEQSSFGQESHRDNVLIGTGWNRDKNGVEEKRTIRPVREWDVGKKESLDRDKNREVLKRRSREREISGNRETDRNGKERMPRSKGRGDIRSSSRSPARKVKKKENDPPLRLLDDLFRKTKSTPCIYWLPLTPEQIAEKEAFRQKRLEEHKQRIKQRELEKGKEREKERNRTNERRDRDREREHRRNRSSDRRSRSRDRRRY